MTTISTSCAASAPLGDHRRAEGAGQTGALTLGSPGRAAATGARTPSSPRSFPVGLPWPWTTPASSPTSSGRSGHGPRSPRPCSTGLLPPPLPESPAGRRRRCTGRPGPRRGRRRLLRRLPVAGGWMLVIGDVTGRGAQAASITAQARYTLRTAAALTGDPLVALATLNRALLARRDSALCSVAALALLRRPAPAGADRGRRPPPAFARRRRVGDRGRQAGPVLGASPTPTGRSSTRG